MAAGSIIPAMCPAGLFEGLLHLLPQVVAEVQRPAGHVDDDLALPLTPVGESDLIEKRDRQRVAAQDGLAYELHFSVEDPPRSDVGLGLAANPNEYFVIAGARATPNKQLEIAVVREVTKNQQASRMLRKVRSWKLPRPERVPDRCLVPQLLPTPRRSRQDCRPLTRRGARMIRFG